MKKLSKQEFLEIDKWMHLNARELELKIWNYHFGKVSKKDVILALMYYQNSDGGFGNTLEPDSWNPNSSPYTTLRAINILKDVDFVDINHPVYQGIIKFLESGVHSSKNGWYFSIPINDHYPHAPWWSYDEKKNQYESIGITAELSGFILRYLKDNTELYKKALRYSDMIFSGLDTVDKHGDMGIMGYCRLLEDIKCAGLTDKYDIEALEKKLKILVNGSIEKDTSKWQQYSVRPSKYIKSPDSIYLDDNKEILFRELEYLIETRPQNGVWGISWSWFENNEKYPKEFAISENWWKASIAIDNVFLLNNFDMIEFQ